MRAAGTAGSRRGARLGRTASRPAVGRGRPGRNRRGTDSVGDAVPDSLLRRLWWAALALAGAVFLLAAAAWVRLARPTGG